MYSVNKELFGQDVKIKKAVDFAFNVAVTKVPVLIVGESGTGKKTLAKLIHEQSSRREKDFLVVDCSEDPISVENAILGHRDEETGRFHKGVLEQGNGGTVVLSKIEGLEENFQKRLFKIFMELPDYEIDVRLIATTTKNISKLVGSGRFYRALYTHFSKTQIQISPLRDRPEDIQLLTNHFIHDLAVEKGVEPPQIEKEAFDKILSYYWTHNISELKSVIEKSLETIEDGVLALKDLAIGEKKAMSFSVDDDEDGIKLMSLKEAEKLLIKKALIHTSENRTQAAKILGVSIRTLRNKINEYRNEGANYFVNLR